MTRRWALAAALALVASCSRGEGAPPSAIEARRVVSLAPSVTESLFAIGAGDRVVGRSRYCDWPPEASRLPTVGGLEPDFEAILQLQPDLVVGTPSGESSRLAEQLSTRGIATWFPVSESLASIDELLRGLGDRTGHSREARRLVAELDAREQTIQRAVAAEPAPRVLMVVGTGPVVAAGPRSFADELLRRAGAVNVVDAGPPWPALGFEHIVELDPDVIIDSSGGADGVAHVTREAAGWSGLRAVRDGRVFVLDDERVVRPGPRIAEGLALLARSLHPASTVR